MALFNKLFPRLKSTTQNTHEVTNVSSKAAAFNAEQIRIVLFRECDFRGRKLLFDSRATEKILVEKAEQDKMFSEVSNGYGYSVSSKQNSDYPQLSEMIFGSVAMSFRGTYFKIHSLGDPSRLIFTQVFPSPSSRRKKMSLASSHHSPTSIGSSFEHSMKLDDSGASSTYSTSDQLSDRSTVSDTVLVCRRQFSNPLDVPGVSSSFSKNSLVVDSGCADQSFCSFSSGPINYSTWEQVFPYKNISALSFSSSGVFKRLIRTSSRSLQNSSISLPNSSEEVLPKSQNRNSKLGLSIIIELPPESEEFLTQFFMEHIALLEALIWRTRRSVELAYHRPAIFLSQMVNVAASTASWLYHLVSAPKIVENLWRSLLICDNRFSINKSLSDCSAISSELDWTLDGTSNISLSSSLSTSLLSDYSNYNNTKGGLTRSFSGLPFRRTEKTDVFNFNLSKFLKTDLWDSSDKRTCDSDFAVEKFLKEFCELLEAFDIKDTNFFMSTLLTVVLTHHLGWVATVFPSSSIDKEVLCNFKQPYNALWSQLTDLYGAVGHPVKTAQTIITGSNKNNIVTKVLNSLTYFIRFGNVERRNVVRECVEVENKGAEIICSKNNCIPKEYYKRYEDHLKEMISDKVSFLSCSKTLKELPNSTTKLNEETAVPKITVPSEEESLNIKHGKALIKVKNLTNLSHILKEEESLPQFNNLGDASELKPSFGLNLVKRTSCRDLKNLEKENIEEPKTSLFSGCEQIRSSSSQKCSDIKKKSLLKSCTIDDFTKFENEIDTVNQDGCDVNQNMKSENTCDRSSVIFVLGENDTLVGLKKEEVSASVSNSSMPLPNKQDSAMVSGAKRKISTTKRPTTLNLSKSTCEFTKNHSESRFSENAKDFQKSLVNTSSSFESLCIDNKENDPLYSEEAPQRFVRAQSEPPENRKLAKPKLKYSQVKFNLQQYPQVVRNYMKSKNIELEGLALGEKAFDKFATFQHNIKLDFSGYESESEEMEALQTPSNASELEYTSDMFSELSENKSKGKETSRVEDRSKVMKIVNIPMPKSLTVIEDIDNSVAYSSSVIKGVVDDYLPDMVLQGTSNSKQLWHSKLRSNLAMNTQHFLLDQPVEESLAIVANTDTWEVQIMSSHTYVIDKGSNGVRVGMSQLVSSMLESLLQMWKLRIPSHYCILHIEQRLQELCVRSKALAQMLLASEFCSMELLTSTLRIEVNDVPLLMAVASTHSPEVTRKYGLSFQ